MHSKLYSEGENDRKKLKKKGEKTDRMVYMNPTKGGLAMFWTSTQVDCSTFPKQPTPIMSRSKGYN